jgi:uncharacterized protein YfbU (UPF0304 family)
MHRYIAIAFGSILFLILFSSCCKETPTCYFHSLTKHERVSLTNQEFSFPYTHSNIEVKPKIPQYPLPLDLEKIGNYKEVAQRLRLGGAKDLLSKNGFVVIQSGQTDDIIHLLKFLKGIGIPIIITPDIFLHLYHIQFNETLKEIEDKILIQDITAITQELLKASIIQYRTLEGSVKEAAKRNVAFFAVALKLLEPDSKIPPFVEDLVRFEIEHITRHEGFPPGEIVSPIFKYKEDYSQYVPRGHYTQSERLKRYFKAMMWYGRMGFLLKGGRPYGPRMKYLISEEDAKIQTIQATLITLLVRELRLGERSVFEIWDKVYKVVAFFTGFSDDLTLLDYQDVILKVLGDRPNLKDLDQEEKLYELKLELARRGRPRIYGGTGACEFPPGADPGPEKLDEVLSRTAGLRFMGQRFIPDSYIFQNLIMPVCVNYYGDGPAFTLSVGGRGFPRGLDIMTVLGSRRARQILARLQDDAYEGYDRQIEKLRSEFDAIPEAVWRKNLYWSWLFTLKTLLQEYPVGYQRFMRTQAWQDMCLSTALSSWTELRHDTILYGKQSYTPAKMAILPRKTKGYVIPVPRFYSSLLSLVRMTLNGLTDMGVLFPDGVERLKELETVLERTLEISVKELQNKALTESDYHFIQGIGERLDSPILGLKKEGRRTTIVVDVHTDQNTRMVLEEAVGYVDVLVACYCLPDGELVIGAGPVLSYYEFKHPMKDRLTNAAWRKILKSPKVPPRPEWTHTFLALAAPQGK